MGFFEHEFAGDASNWDRGAGHAVLEPRIRRLPHELYGWESMPADAPEQAPYDYGPELRAASAPLDLTFRLRTP